MSDDVDRARRSAAAASSSSFTNADGVVARVLDAAGCGGSGTAPRTGRRRSGRSRTGRDARLPDRLDQAERAAAQRGFEQHRLVLASGSPWRRARPGRRAPPPGGRSGPRPDGITATRQLEPAVDHDAAVQRRDQAGTDQRRLAAAGGADDREEPVRSAAGATARRSRCSRPKKRWSSSASNGRRPGKGLVEDLSASRSTADDLQMRSTTRMQRVAGTTPSHCGITIASMRAEPLLTGVLGGDEADRDHRLGRVRPQAGALLELAQFSAEPRLARRRRRR